MRLNVNKPSDSLFQLENISVNLPDNAYERKIDSIGRCIIAPSAWSIKTGNLTSVHIGAVHPAWVYSGMDYAVDSMELDVGFRNYNAGPVSQGKAHVPNPKKDYEVTTMVNVINPSTIESNMTDNIPIHYYGQPYEEKKPTDSGAFTFLTDIIDSEYVEVNCLSPYEYEIVVKQDLTTDQYFYLPRSSAKGLADTIWGEVGDESTLPDGACAGLIKVRAESLLDAKQGQYMVTGDDLLAVKHGSFTVYENQAQDFSPSAYPSWFTNIDSNTIQSTSQWQTLNKLVQNSTEYFACGFQVGASTIGTGLFVRDNNQVGVLPYGYTTTGISCHKTFQQKINNVTRSVKMRDFLDCGINYFKELGKIGLNMEPLSDGSLVPFCAATLQYIDNVPPLKGFYRMPIDSVLNYAYPPFSTKDKHFNVDMTPVYLPIGAKQHCYVPPITNRTSTIVSMILVNDMDADVVLALKPNSDWLFPVTNKNLPESIKENPDIKYTSAEDPTRGYDRDQIGFKITTASSTYKKYVSSDTYVIYAKCSATIEWVNPFSDPTIGTDSRVDFYTNNAMVSGMVMAFTGFLPAGTKAGTYLWKPFKTAQRTARYLVADTPEFHSQNIDTDLVINTMDAPFIGLNIITVESPYIEWDCPEVSDEAGDYKYYQVMHRLNIDKASTDLLWDEIRVIINSEVVPLVGYPIADKPMLIDIDDWSGENVCDIGDLTMTSPFFDKDLQEWVVIAASAQTGRMYRLNVEVDDTKKYVTRFLTVRDSRELFDTPYGHFVEILGLCHTKDIYYTGKAVSTPIMEEVLTDPSQAYPVITSGQSVETGVSASMNPYQVLSTKATVGDTFEADTELRETENTTATDEYLIDDHLVIYGRTEPDESSMVKGSNLVVATCRTYMEWDVNRDTITRIRIADQVPTDFVISDVTWPKSIAVMFPYLYILGYQWTTTPTDPIVSPLDLLSATSITGSGWQMCLWKVDITSGVINESILLTDSSDFRFGYGIPALDKDANALFRADKDSIGTSMMKYTWGTTNPNTRAVSTSLPKKGNNWEYPAISGLCYSAGQLMAFSNYLERPVLINPITACIETEGLSIFPFTYPFNDNVASENDTVAVVAKFGNKPFYTVHPFYQLCIGDGTPPNNYGMGIDVHDITTGRKLLRKCLLRNNSLRDRLEGVTLTVPEPSILKGSEMLYLSLTGKDTDKDKSITLPDVIEPSSAVPFYLHVEPDGEYDENLILYLNAKFDRITQFFGYRTN